MADTNIKYAVQGFVRQKYHYILVHWKDYDDPKDFTWEPKVKLKEDLGVAYYSLLDLMKKKLREEEKAQKEVALMRKLEHGH
tara:strand:- start:551 stop:796 length:246 start_codon:yes stop_codon:yes gene_type:complete